MYKTYQEMYYSINNMDDIVNRRLEMVKMAEEIGMKATARFYNTDRNTVRKWCRRYQVEGLDGLKDRHRKPITDKTNMK